MKINLGLFLLFGFAVVSSAAGHRHWVVTWGASPSPQLNSDAQMQKAKLDFDNQTIREIVHTSVGSDTVRVRLSNAYGKEPLQIGSAHIALREKESAIIPASDHALTFSGRSSVSIPPNALVLSDPVKLNVPALSDLAITLFIPTAEAASGIHYAAQQTAYIGKGDLTGTATIADPETITSWVFLTSVDVLAPDSSPAIAAFGDSITDGSHSTVDANRRWPNFLANRLDSDHSKAIGVLDAGIGGNRILHDAYGNVAFGVNALARFDRDVLAQAGIKYVIVLEGINDIGHAPGSAPASQEVTADDIIAGLKQLIARAHEKGLKIFGATLTPFEGTTYKGYFTPEKELKRKAVNQWIRSSHAFDGVIDFDKAVRDPNHPDRMLPKYDGGDHLHPSDAGYEAMGNSVPLSLFH
jgi:lysophospholipase L1-like esterase